MIIDCHGHYTTAPPELQKYRDSQIAGLKDPAGRPAAANLKISDDQIRESLEGAQLKFQRERGTDITIFSPRASAMAHHIGDETTSLNWSRACNDLIHRVCSLYPENFVGVCQLPQSPGVAPGNSAAELERCVRDLGFIGCNLNPDPSGGHWDSPPLTDRHWYPLYEKMVELDVPAMVYDPQNGLPATVGLHQAKPATYLDLPLQMHTDAVDKPEPTSPLGTKGVGEPPLGSAAAALLCAISDALGGHVFNRTPVSPDMIINFTAGRAQSHKPLQIHTF